MGISDRFWGRVPVKWVRDHHRHLARGHQPIYLDYPVDPRQRYGTENGPHPDLARLLVDARPAAAGILEGIAGHAAKLAAIPQLQPSDDRTPYWMNGWIQALDPASLYAMPAIFGSRLYIEVGSGNSTKFVRRSVDDGTSSVRIVSVDPAPRVGIDILCDEVVRQPLEDVDLALFDRLDSGDILMIDNSHRCFQNSDVTVVFLDILPRLKPGVVVYIDDIFLPFDYPEHWRDRFYSEQYLLGTMLLADAGRRYEILLPGYFAGVDPVMKAQVADLWARLGMETMNAVVSNGFWMRVRG